MGAVAEMPGAVQVAVRMRIERGLTDDQIAEAMDVDPEDVRQLIAQGQAILDRSLGPEFKIERISYGDETEDEEIEWPSMDDEVEEEETPRAVSRPHRQPGVGDLIARSVEALTSSAAVQGADAERARSIITEALRDAGDLFRLAAQRIGSGEEPSVPLRAALAEAEGEEINLVVESPGDAARFFVALDALEPVQWARVSSISSERAEYRVMAGSVMSLVRALMAMEDPFRPARLQMSGDVITFEMAEEPAASPGAPVIISTRPAGESPQIGPRFELSVDAFFGARHFISSKGQQGPPHHHSYRVEATIGAPGQDRDGFVLGFAEARELVESTVMEFSETLLNTVEPFGELQPTTENLARVVHERIAARLNGSGAWLKHVRVWESPTNSATYTDVATAV